MSVPKIVFRVTSNATLRRQGAADGLATVPREIRDALNTGFAAVDSDAHLTDAGKASVRITKARLAVPRATSRLNAIDARYGAVTREIEQARESRRPMAATEFEQQLALRWVDRIQDAERRGNKAEASRLRDMLRSEDPDSQTHRIQVALTALPAGVLDQVSRQYQLLLQNRFDRDLSPRAVELTGEAEALMAEREQLLELRGQLVRAVGRDALEEAGVVEKAPTKWSSDERAAFIAEHGEAAYRQKLSDELRESLGAPASTFSAASVGVALPNLEQNFAPVPEPSTPPAAA